MLTKLFDFELPADRIALRPVSPRDAARLLVVRPGEKSEFEDRTVRDLPGLLRSGDVVVFNDTKVIPARLLGHRVSRATRPRIEATLHYSLGDGRWLAFVRPARKLVAGDVVRFTRQDLGSSIEAVVESKREGGEVSLAFAATDQALYEIIRACGTIPLPPYIASRRSVDDQDVIDYQTLFAEKDGSVAAPTAGLHFTEELVARLKKNGVWMEAITLHVGAGTFLPVHAEDTDAHYMQSERAFLTLGTADRINSARRNGGRIVAVGSTSLRVLESATGEDGIVRPFDGETNLFISPGYKFKSVDLMLTNFHLPRSTLFMLVAAFAGLELMRRAYSHAIETGYRFYSYGDACLLHASPTA
jgi:S-adenosylmethionine:tRNA ribosyltransferase-isomerase